MAEMGRRSEISTTWFQYQPWQSQRLYQRQRPLTFQAVSIVLFNRSTSSLDLRCSWCQANAVIGRQSTISAQDVANLRQIARIALRMLLDQKDITVIIEAMTKTEGLTGI